MELREKIRNFCIIAHIDHGKSTLADRFLELTGTVEKEKLQPQYLDQLSVERKHGVTVKMQPVRLKFKDYILNLIDTPGHSDFSYEVSRALMAVDGCLLLVDVTQGIQAQTVYYFEEAKKLKKTIIPVINKIDLKKPEESLKIKLKEMTGIQPLTISAKTGEGVENLLEKLIEIVNPPEEFEEDLALIFDSHYQDYFGVVFHVRIFGGTFQKGETIFLPHLNERLKITQVGYFTPQMKEAEKLSSGEIGYIVCNLKKTNPYLVGESITKNSQIKNIFEFKKPQNFIFASFFPAKESDFLKFKEVIEKICLNDPSLSYEEIYFKNFGRGFKIGFLGLFHLQIIKERIEEEFKTEIIITFPLIHYKAILKNGKEIYVSEDLPPENEILKTQEPWVEVFLITPKEYQSSIFELIKQKRGLILEKNEIDKLEIRFEMPLEELITNFYDLVKSKSSGYASFWWVFKEYKDKKIGKLDILVNGTKIFSLIVSEEKAQKIGEKIVEKLKELLSPESYPLKIQASYKNKIIASRTIPALAKNPASWLYGGDRTRKMKLWKKQKEGQKKLQKLAKGKTKVSPEVLIKVFKEI